MEHLLRLQNFQREIYGVEGFFDELGAGVKPLGWGEAFVNLFFFLPCTLGGE